MSYHVDQPPSSVGRSAVDELSILAKKGATDKTLSSCQALEEVILRGRGSKLVDKLPRAARIELQRKVLNETLAEARQQGLDLLDGPDPPTLAQSAEVPALQVAAAGELLRLTNEAVFNKVRDIRCEQFGRTWSDIESMPDNQGELPRLQLRAAIWIGRRSSRSLRPRQLRRPERELLEALLEWLEGYAERNQEELRALVASGLEPPPAPISDPSALPHGAVGSYNHVVSRQPDRRLTLAGLAVVTVGALITTLAVLQLYDNPDGSPESGRLDPGGSETPGITRLEQLPPCADLPLNSPLAQELRVNNQVIIDGRCHPYPSARVGAQAGPHRRYRGVDHLKNGKIIEDICLVPDGQLTSNKIGQRSRVWVRYQLDSGRDAFTPAIWVHGEEGAQRCSA